MGYGEFVGNESVHWSIAYENDSVETGSVRGRDPIKFANIGTKPPKGRAAAKTAPAKTFLPKPSFRIQMRFPTAEQAERAKASAEIVKVDGVYALQVSVPVVHRKKEQVDPPRPPAEIRVDW
jgi:hypothetical protein